MFSNPRGLINMAAVFYSQDKKRLRLGLKFVDDAIIADAQGVLPIMIADQRFSGKWMMGKLFYFMKDAMIEPEVCLQQSQQILFRLPRKSNGTDHREGAFFFRIASAFFLKASKERVRFRRTCRLARAISSRSSLLERISSVSINPSYSSTLRRTAFSTPFLVMVKRSYPSSASFTRCERCFLASASG